VFDAVLLSLVIAFSLIDTRPLYTLNGRAERQDLYVKLATAAWQKESMRYSQQCLPRIEREFSIALSYALNFRAL